MRESWQRGSQKYKHQNSSDVSPLISTEGKEGLSEHHHGWTERKKHRDSTRLRDCRVGNPDHANKVA